jgi:hypothetical protein
MVTGRIQPGFIDRSSIDNLNAEIWTMRFGGTESERRNISQSVNFDYQPAWGVAGGLRTHGAERPPIWIRYH